MNLDRYRVPDCVTVGEWIELPQSGGAQFRVKLPSSANREWQREVARVFATNDVQFEIDDKGKVSRKPTNALQTFDWREANRDAFARVCVVEGPPGFDLARLLTDYRPALDVLFELAHARANQEDEETAAAVGES